MNNLSEINLLRGDCLELMKDIPDGSIDMILADLPYGTTRNKWDSIISLDLLWEQYNRIIKERGAIVLTAQTPFDKVLGVSNLKYLKYEWIWQKDKGTGHLNAKRMPMKDHENILVFCKRSTIYNPQMWDGGKPSKGGRRKNKNTNYGEHESVDSHGTNLRYPTTVRKFNKVYTHNQLHPTQKPVELFEYLIKTYTNEGETVLDNVMGSGTTGVACKNLNRNFIGMELDETYFNIAKERIENHEIGDN